MAVVDANAAIELLKQGASVVHLLLASGSGDAPPEERKVAYEWLLKVVQKEIEVRK